MLIDLLDKGANCLGDIRCCARVVCPDKLAHLIETACTPSVVSKPTGEFQRRYAVAILKDRVDPRLTIDDILPVGHDAVVHSSPLCPQRLAGL